MKSIKNVIILLLVLPSYIFMKAENPTVYELTLQEYSFSDSALVSLWDDQLKQIVNNNDFNKKLDIVHIGINSDNPYNLRNATAIVTFYTPSNEIEKFEILHHIKLNSIDLAFIDVDDINLFVSSRDISQYFSPQKRYNNFKAKAGPLFIFQSFALIYKISGSSYYLKNILDFDSDWNIDSIRDSLDKHVQ